MLKKDKKPDDDKGFAFDKTAEQKTLSPIPSRETTAEKTVIGEKISIEGNIHGDEHLIIEGSMKGNIEMDKHNFSVGSRGRVEGEINAQSVRISGQMIGNIKTKGKVEITKEADFMGDIRAKSISVEDGAYFKGSIELEREPHRKTASTGESTALKTSQPIHEPKTPTAEVADKEK
ncbi:MAG: polymer-forming cytoskeletal protein [Desulfobacterales bacterium]|jgi:cytoskeletal protein CcmA (bactofilin family)